MTSVSYCAALQMESLFSDDEMNADLLSAKKSFYKKAN